MWCDLDYDRKANHCEGEALAFLGGPGACSPRKFWKSRLSNTHFLCFSQWFYTFTARKNRPKLYTKFLAFRGKWQENELFNQNNAQYIQIFCLDNCPLRTGTWKMAKRQEKLELWLKNKEKRQKAGLKSCFGALIGTNRDESAFLSRQAGRRVSVSKSGLSRRDRDGWQVGLST